MLSKVSVNRLLEAAAILESYHSDPKNRKQFDIGTWKETTVSDDKQLCGTTACACGVIASQPNIRKRGFKLDINEYSTFMENRKGDAVEVKVLEGELTFTDKNGDKLEGFEAAAEYFGIDYSDATELFSSSGYEQYNITAKTVATAIRKYVKHNSKQAA